MASNSKNLAELLNGDVTVTATDIADGSVTTAKLADDAVTAGKVSDEAITTAKLNDAISLRAIDTTIAKTATDVFVYDTRNDTDGGAWRKGCKHTSWYNETLNTSTRGSRREFPQVAIIVADNASATKNVTIYDGDDPDMPMWMVFEYLGTGTTPFGRGNNLSATSVSMLNGFLAIGTSDGGTSYGTCSVSDFNADEFYSYFFATYRSTVGLIHRNDASFSINLWSGAGLQSDYVNDISMTVLENDKDRKVGVSGLPRPYIAVGSNAGVTVIKPDKTTVKGFTSSGQHPINNLGWLSGNRLMVQTSYQGSAQSTYVVDKDLTTLDYYGYNAYPLASEYTQFSEVVGNDRWALDRFGGNPGQGNFTRYGYALYDHVTNDNPSSFNHPDSKVALITQKYNTGWMSGAIKIATLSDTLTGNLDTSTELVSNGSAFVDTTGWSLLNGYAASVSGGQVLVDRNGSLFDEGLQTTITTVVGQQYIISVDVVAFQNSGTAQINVGSVSTQNMGPSYGNALVNMGTLTSTGTYKATFTAQTTTTYVALGVDSQSSGIVTFDNISVVESIDNMTPFRQGPEVIGSLTRTPVATGAELVSYGGWTDSTNYAVMEDEAGAFNFGTSGDYCVMAWVKLESNSNAHYLFDKSDTDGNKRFAAYYVGGQGWTNYTEDGGAVQFQSSVGTTGLNEWKHMVFMRKDGYLRTFENGKEYGTATASSKDLTSAGDDTAYLNIGTRYTENESMQGEIALFRISGTAPSAEEVQRIWEEESHLFKTGSQATLYGDSMNGAPKAYAWDKTKNQVHVATLDGRSVFEGLCRVDNTTDAVASAISVSNGLVVED